MFSIIFTTQEGVCQIRLVFHNLPIKLIIIEIFLLDCSKLRLLFYVRIIIIFWLLGFLNVLVKIASLELEIDSTSIAYFNSIICYPDSGLVKTNCNTSLEV